jgi:hypothetical protein
MMTHLRKENESNLMSIQMGKVWGCGQNRGIFSGVNQTCDNFSGERKRVIKEHPHSS